MSKRTVSHINLDDWYTNEEAVERLSQNSGRPIDRNYPRTLAKYGKITSISLGRAGKLYLRSDIDRYIVSTQRGPKARKEDHTHGRGSEGKETRA